MGPSNTGIHHQVGDIHWTIIGEAIAMNPGGVSLDW
jgi:hypothetical protein